MASKWKLDPAHSEVTFKVKHMMIAHSSGQITKFDVSASAEDDQFSNPVGTFTAEVASIKTGDDQRDGHLQSADFFNAAEFPEIKFVTQKVAGDKIHGDLTIKGITKPVVLDFDFGGINKDPWGQTKAGFTISGKINRKDWDLTWNAALETGGFLVGEEVKVNVEIQLVKEA